MLNESELTWLRLSPSSPASVTESRSAGTAQLGPPIIACERQPATAPDPHSKTPLETPLVDQDVKNIIPFLDSIKRGF